MAESKGKSNVIRILLFTHQVGISGRDYGPIIPDGMFLGQADREAMKKRLLTDLSCRYDEDILRKLYLSSENVKEYMTERHIYDLCKNNDHNLIFRFGLKYYGWSSDFNTMAEVREAWPVWRGTLGIMLESTPHSTAGLKRYYRERLIMFDPDDEEKRKNKKIKILEGEKLNQLLQKAWDGEENDG
ncbi:MAG: hypothetical protein LUE87_08340 [Lachnospiraceae bacterium]|nr:hypothetical protein [Lachnospiraceae bacterium]